MIEKIGTGSMSREEWNTLRRASLGGSDAPAALGVSAYKSPFALWCEKTGKLPPPGISDRESVRLGTDLEGYVARRFAEVSGKRLARVNFTVKNSEYPFAHANIDRRVVGERAGFEAKTSSSWAVAADCRAGELPAAWRAQCMHYLMVTGWERWYLAVLCFGQGLFRFVIERSESEIAALADAERAFWTLVETGTPPDADGSEATGRALEQLYEESETRAVDLSAAAPQLREYERLDLDDLYAGYHTLRGNHFVDDLYESAGSTANITSPGRASRSAASIGQALRASAARSRRSFFASRRQGRFACPCIRR